MKIAHITFATLYPGVNKNKLNARAKSGESRTSRVSSRTRRTIGESASLPFAGRRNRAKGLARVGHAWLYDSR